MIRINHKWINLNLGGECYITPVCDRNFGASSKLFLDQRVISKDRMERKIFFTCVQACLYQPI